MVIALAGQMLTHSPQPLQLSVFIKTWVTPPTTCWKWIAWISQASPQEWQITPRSEKHSLPITAIELKGADCPISSAPGRQTAAQTSQKSQPDEEKFISGKEPSATRMTFTGHCFTHSPQRVQVLINSFSLIAQGGRTGRRAVIFRKIKLPLLFDIAITVHLLDNQTVVLRLNLEMTYINHRNWQYQNLTEYLFSLTQVNKQIFIGIFLAEEILLKSLLPLISNKINHELCWNYGKRISPQTRAGHL